MYRTHVPDWFPPPISRFGSNGPQNDNDVGQRWFGILHAHGRCNVVTISRCLPWEGLRLRLGRILLHLHAHLRRQHELCPMGLRPRNLALACTNTGHSNRCQFELALELHSGMSKSSRLHIFPLFSDTRQTRS